MKLFKLWLVAVICLVLVSCGDDDSNPDFPVPSVSFADNSNADAVVIGEAVVKTISASASAGLASIDVQLDGATFDTQTFTDQTFVFDYDLNFTVPSTASSGDSFVFSITVTDLVSQSSDALTYTVTAVAGSKFQIEDVTLGGTAVKKISPAEGAAISEVNEDLTLDAAQPWLIEGPTLVNNGATLTIEAGVTVYASADEDETFLSIQQGAQIDANGTATSPIVFTSSNALGGTPAPGDWDGIYLLGSASTNLSGADLDLGTPGTFGGTSDDDDSGEMSYVRIEYAGKNAPAALTVRSAGSATQLDHIQAFNSAVSGIQIYGGSVDLKYAVVVGNSNATQDHAMNLRHGWTGRGQFWVVQASAVTDDPRTIELRNNPDAPQATPRTAPTLSNLTLIGPGQDAAMQNPEFGNRGLRLRAGTAGNYHNFAITQFPDDAFRIDDDPESDHQGLLDNGDLVFNGGNVWNNDDNDGDLGGDIIANAANNISADVAIDGLDIDAWVGSTTTNAFDPTSLGDWFSAASFIGAIENASNDWTADGDWCKNSDGSIR